jgi:hypothetical protein
MPDDSVADCSDLDALDSLLAKATPARWAVMGPGGGVWYVLDPHTDEECVATCGRFDATANATVRDGEADACAIAALRNAAPALIAELRKLRAFKAAVDLLDAAERRRP